MTDLYARRDLVDEEHEALRASVREFLNRHVISHIEEWEDQEEVPRDIWQSAGQQGFLGLSVSVAEAVLRAISVDVIASLSLQVVAAGGTLQPLAPQDLAELPDLGSSLNLATAWRHELARLG